MYLSTFLITFGFALLLVTYSIYLRKKGIVFGLIAGLIMLTLGAQMFLDPLLVPIGETITRTENTSIADFNEISQTARTTYERAPPGHNTLVILLIMLGLYIAIVNALPFMPGYG